MTITVGVATAGGYSCSKFNYYANVTFTPDANNSLTSSDVYTVYANISFTNTISITGSNASITNDWSLTVNTLQSATTESYTRGSGSGTFTGSSTSAGANFATAGTSYNFVSFAKNGSLTTNNVNTNSLTTNSITANSIGISSQLPTWYIYGSGANGTTTASNIIGASTNTGTGRFNTIEIYGGASTSNWNTATATFTAPTAGTYYFQLNCFFNLTGTVGRNMTFVSTSFMGTQYAIFDIASTTTEMSSQWTTLIYLNAGGTAYFQNTSTISIVLFYAKQHSNLTITKLF